MIQNPFSSGGGKQKKDKINDFVIFSGLYREKKDEIKTIFHDVKCSRKLLRESEAVNRVEGMSLIFDILIYAHCPSQY